MQSVGITRGNVCIFTYISSTSFTRVELYIIRVESDQLVAGLKDIVHCGVNSWGGERI